MKTVILALFTAFIDPHTAMAQNRTLTLEQFLDAAGKESPDLAVENAGIEAASARADGIRLNPPMVGLMQMRDGGSSRSGFEITQELPFPTKLAREKNVRELEFQTQKESATYRRIIVLADARAAYVAFWSAYEKLKIQKARHDWLNHHVKLTRAATRSDSSAQIHLLEVESDADAVENEVLGLEAQVVEKRNELKTFAPTLDFDATAPSVPPFPSIDIVDSNNNALVSWKAKELKTREAIHSLRKQAYIPDLFLRLRSYNGNESTPQTQELMVGINLPFLFFWQPRAEVAEASAMKTKAEAELRRSQIEIESRLKSRIQIAESLKTQLANLKAKLIPRAEHRKRLLANLSVRTMEGLNEHKTVMLALLDLQTKAVDLQTEYESNFKEILKLAGIARKVGAL